MKLTVKEYADLKSISESTVKNRIRDKKIQAVQEDGKYFIIVKDTRRIIPQQEKALRTEMKLLKKEIKMLKDNALRHENELNEIDELRAENQRLHNKLHDKNDRYEIKLEDIYGEMKQISQIALKMKES
jgi:predicted  nucleic acid-binding Zn-ribbon protein